MLAGVKIVVELFFITLILSIPLGLIVAFIRLSKSMIARNITGLYIWVMRGSPLLLQMMFLYYGLPLINENLVLNQMTVAILAFAINYAAYFAEIFRAGLQSIDKGQFEAAKVLSFDKFTMYRKIILPQVIKNVLPPIANEAINLVKDSSLVYILGINDLLRLATAASNRTASLMPFLYAGVIYLIITAVLTKCFAYMEKRYGYYQ